MKKIILKIILFPLNSYNYLKKKLRLIVLTQSGIKIGQGTYISPKAYIDRNGYNNITIGKNCFIARNSMILCHTSVTKGGPEGIWVKYGGKMEFLDVIIGDNVLVGGNAVILPGVIIGNNVVIGSNCVVNKNVPSGKVIGGVPFKIIMETKALLKNKCKYFDESDWNKNFVD